MFVVRSSTNIYRVVNTKPVRDKSKFSSVFIAYDESGKKYILKRLNKSLNTNKHAVKRFSAENIIKFNHKNIAKTIEYFIFEDNHYLVRHFIEGKDLDKLKIRDKKLLLKCFCQILEALNVLHSNGIIHRDIKPSNIILEEDKENCVLIDFGLIKLQNDEYYNTMKSPFSLIYSPPEQVLNFPDLINESSDTYSAGISLYEKLTNKRPFYHSNPEILMNLQITYPLKPDRKIDDDLFDIIKKSTSKYYFRRPPNRYNRQKLRELLISGQQKRYFSAGEMSEDLKKFFL